MAGGAPSLLQSIRKRTEERETGSCAVDPEEEEEEGEDLPRKLRPPFFRAFGLVTNLPTPTPHSKERLSRGKKHLFGLLFSHRYEKRDLFLEPLLLSRRRRGTSLPIVCHSNKDLLAGKGDVLASICST